jgi:UDP-N-acetylglucosamine 2-epimerase (non-hydrolysing)
MVKIAVFVGTRPEIIKMCPVIEAMLNASFAKLIFAHTGQHYAWNLSKSFIEELKLPEPEYFLDVGSGSHARQTARIMERSERVLVDEHPDMVLVQGDTNSALGVALASAKVRIPVGHVEAGCRSFDKRMPEEINRIVIADCASIHFAPTHSCVQNLRAEGIHPRSIHLTGHPIVGLVRRLVDSDDGGNTLNRFGVTRQGYVLLTVHREENADDPLRLRRIVKAACDIDVPVLLPVHPRTRKNLRRFGIPIRGITAIRPIGYVDTLNLIRNARLVVTDSGGIQQESYLLKTPCITLRERTEWPETVAAGVNFLAGSNMRGLAGLCQEVLENEGRIRRRFKHARQIFGGPRSATNILIQLKMYLKRQPHGQHLT